MYVIHHIYSVYIIVVSQREKSLEDFMSPWKGICLSLFGIIMYVADIGSDLFLAISYFINGDTKWAVWTLSFVVIHQLVLIGGFLCKMCDGDIREGCQLIIYPIYM